MNSQYIENQHILDEKNCLDPLLLSSVNLLQRFIYCSIDESLKGGNKKNEIYV